MNSSPWSKASFKTLWWVLLVALAVRLLYLLLFSRTPDWEHLTIDNWYHHNWALTIIKGNIIGDTTYFRAPFYVWCLAAVYALFGVSLWVARLMGVVLGVASVGMTWLIGRRLAGERVGTIAAIVQTLCPIMISFEAELLLDPLFTLLAQVAFWHYLRWDEKPGWRSFLLFSVVTGIAAVTRPTILGLVPLIGIFVVWRFRHFRAALIQHLLAGVIGLSVTVGVPFIRNLAVAADPVLVASQGGINFYVSNNPSADGFSAAMPPPYRYNWRIKDITYLAEKDAGHELKPGEVSSYWSGKAFEWMVANPVQFAGLTIKRLWFNVANIEISNNRLIPALYDRIWLLGLNPVRFGVLFGLALIGWIVAWRRNRGVRIGLVFVVAYMLLNCVFFYNSRFRLPLLPIYIVAAAIAINELWMRRGRLHGRIWLVGVAAAAISFLPIYRLPAGVSTQDLTSKGLMSYNSGDYVSALANYRQAAAYDSIFPGTNLNLGATFLRLGQVDSAAWYLRRELAQYPDCADAYSNLASIYLLQGDPRRAQEYARRSVALRPYNATANILLVRALLDDSAITVAEIRNETRVAVARTGIDIRVCNEAGAALEERGDLAYAATMYLSAARFASPPTETDDELFESTYERTAARRKQERAKANFALGSLAGRQGEFAQAVLYSRRAIELDSMLTSPYVNLISAYVKLGDSRAADSVLIEALRRFPENSVLRQIAAQFRH